MRAITVFALCVPLLYAPNGCANGGAWSTDVAIETRWFPDAPPFPGQPAYTGSLSLSLSPRWRWQSVDGRQTVTLEGFARWDQRDPERTHIDVREALWEQDLGRWTIAAGIGQVFWGVTESRHLVDVINARDGVEDIDEEDRLGQPMLRVERLTDTGSWAVWALPGSRPRTFPHPSARLRGPLTAVPQPSFESGAGRRRLDAAARWTYGAGSADLGLSAFYGTSREPRLLTDGSRWTARYDVTGQVSVDAQWTTGPWLLKAEALYRTGPGYGFTASVAGVEVTPVNVWATRADLSLIAEYLYDGRPGNAPPTLFDDDLFVGLRWAANDLDATDVLVGLYYDRSSAERIGYAEARRRLGSHWTLEMEARWLRSVHSDNVLYRTLANDRFLTVRLTRLY